MNTDPFDYITITLNPAWDCTIQVAEPFSCGHVHKVIGERITPGGKGINVAKTLITNGKRVAVTGFLGEDDAVKFRSEIVAMGMFPLFFPVAGATRTNLMIRSSSGEMKFNRPGFPSLQYDVDDLLRQIADMVTSQHIVIVSGALPARFPDDLYRTLMNVLHEIGCHTILDTSGKALLHGVKGRPLIIKPNRLEIEEMAGRSLRNDLDVERFIRQLAHQHEVVIVSDGPRGAWFASGDLILRGDSPDVPIIDTTGAGDAMLGQFCADYFPERCLTNKLAARALAAGAAAVEQSGTPPLDMQRILDLSAQVSPRQCS